MIAVAKHHSSCSGETEPVPLRDQRFSQQTRQETGAVLRGIETQEGTRLLKTVEQGFK